MCGDSVYEYSSRIGEEEAKKIGDETELRLFDAKDKECCYTSCKTSKGGRVSSEVGRNVSIDSHLAVPRWYPCTSGYL